MNRRGQMLIYIITIFIGLFLMILGAVFLPVLTNVTVIGYTISQQLWTSANDTVSSQVINQTVKDNLVGAMDGALDSVETNITVETTLFKYWWIIVLLAMVLMLFVATRQLVETGGGNVG